MISYKNDIFASRKEQKIETLNCEEKKFFYITQEKINNLKNAVNPAEFNCYIANIINDIELEDSFDSMIKMTDSVYFNSNEISIIPEFIQALISFLENDKFTCNVLYLLINLWYVQSYCPILMNEDLINCVMKKCYSINLNVVQYAFSSFANLASYFPNLFNKYLNDEFTQLLMKYLSNEVPYGILDPLIRFVLCLVGGSKTDFFVKFIPNFIDILKNKIPKIVSFDSDILSCLIKKEENLKIIYDNNFIAIGLNSFHLLSSEQHFGIYNCILSLINYGIIDEFTTDNFISILSNDFNQYFRTPASTFFNVVLSLMKYSWKEFYEFGFITQMIDCSNLIEFCNKECLILTLISFFDFCDLDTMCKVFEESNIFTFLTEMLVCLDTDSIVKLLNHLTNAILRNSSLKEIIIQSRFIDELQSNDEIPIEIIQNFLKVFDNYI